MKKKCNRKKCASFFLCAVLLLMTLCSCGGQTAETEEVLSEPVTITMILRANPNTGIKDQEELIEAFNEAYDGIYSMDVTWIMETEEEERQNMKQLNVTDSLPTIFNI